MRKVADKSVLAWSALQATPRLGAKRLVQVAVALHQRQRKGGELMDADVQELESLGLGRALADSAASHLSDPPEPDLPPPGSVLLTPDDPDYPVENLNPQLPVPVLLYAAGNVALLRRRGVAVSGSRAGAKQAMRLASRIAGLLAETGINVISGHAAGIDETAHEEALRAGGTTTAVLAEGLLRFSPRPGIKGADPDRILVISGFRPARRWTVYQAMERNNWIAALAQAVVVIASDVRGGSWAQARLCLDAGKRLLVPDFTEAVAPGNRQLIKQGALPIDPEDPRSVLEHLSSTEVGSSDNQTSFFG
ncbi:MAG: DNA-processing protein DprA [Gemmatimonadota bacterium]